MAFQGPPRDILSSPPVAQLPQVVITLHPGGQVETRTNLQQPGAWPLVVNLLLQALLSARQEEEKERQASGAQSRIVVPQGVVVG